MAQSINVLFDSTEVSATDMIKSQRCQALKELVVVIPGSIGLVPISSPSDMDLKIEAIKQAVSDCVIDGVTFVSSDLHRRYLPFAGKEAT